MTAIPVRVVVLGDLMTDVVTRTSGPIAVGSDTSAQIELRGGGSAANVAAWLGAAGHPVTLVGSVGEDALGRAATEELESLGVRTRLTVEPTRPTGTCVVLVTRDGERSMLPDAGANASLRPDDLPVQEFVPGAHLHLSGYTLLRASTRPAALAALELARSADMTISIDPASSAPIRTIGVDQVRGWLQDVHLVLPNLDELYVLVGRAVPTVDEPGQVRRDSLVPTRDLAEQLGAIVVTTCGSSGAVAVIPHSLTAQQEAVSVQAVDATGCGDAFAAGFLRAWLGGQDGPVEDRLAAALRRATAAGATCATQVGARPRTDAGLG